MGRTDCEDAARLAGYAGLQRALACSFREFRMIERGGRCLTVVRQNSVESRPEVVCQVFFVVAPIDVSSGEPRRLSALRYVDSSYGVRVCQQR